MRPIAFLVAAAALASGCGGDDDAPGGADAPGSGVRYQLVRVGDDSLPAVIGSRRDCGVYLTGGSVVFPGDRTYRSEFAIESRCPGGEVEDLDDPGTAGAVRFQGDTAFFSDTLGNPAGKGVLAAESLVVRGTIHRLVYLRELGQE